MKKDNVFPCLSLGEGFVYKWRKGIQSSFPRLLLELIVRADDKNLEKIRLGFPEQVEAWEEWHKDGVKYENMLNAKVDEWKRRFSNIVKKSGLEYMEERFGKSGG